MPSSVLALALTLGLLLSAPADDPAAPESFTPQQREHWAFRPVKRTDMPEVAEARWSLNPIDRFVRSATLELGLKHAPEADRVALIRRVTYDLTGVPPSPEAVFAFVSDPMPDAYERVVDRLLASPQYGERWAQHWLDLAAYADTNGFELDADRPDAWRYRDWVVQSFNDDMPYDRFVKLQIAGDEVEPGTSAALIATGFARCGPREVVGGNILPEVKRQEELTGITSTVSSVFLGLTMGCARCHDHKFDPLPTTDYYRLQSFFASSEMIDRPIASEAEESEYKAIVKRIDDQAAPLLGELAELEKPIRETLRERKKGMLTDSERTIMAIPEGQRTEAQKKLAQGAQKALNVTWEEVAAAFKDNAEGHARREALKLAIHTILVQKPEPPAKAMALVDTSPKAPDTFVHRRGDVKSRGPRVVPRPPGILLAAQPADAFSVSIEPLEQSTRRRLELARWMTRPDNPLTPRVIVNRLWASHFGRGIVATPSDFGVRGESPSHPELLDWLASELIAGGWKLKPMHRLMVTSAAYRQSSRVAPESFKKEAEDDPENSFLWRMNRRRLDAEGVRDALLVASGELNPARGGPGVKPPIEKEIEDLIFTEAEVVDLWPETPDPGQWLRRSLYLFRKRNVRYALFDAFDAPDTQTSCPSRGVSTHALQPLVTLNSQFVLDRARALSRRILAGDGTDNADRVDRAYNFVLNRAPTFRECVDALDFLAKQTRFHESAKKTAPADEAWIDFSLAMLNRNEFFYIP